MFDFKFYIPMNKFIEFFKEIFGRNDAELDKHNDAYMSSEEEYESWLGV